MPEIMGFDFFDIDYTLEVGVPPYTTMVLRGNFDMDLVVATHIARDYTETEINGVQVMCGPVGCENGSRTDLAYVDWANMFDGGLGRQPPFAILPNTLVSAYELDILENAIHAINGESPSLAEAEDFRTVAEAILNPNVYSGDLVQAQFLSSQYLNIALDLNNPRTNQYIAETSGHHIEQFKRLLADYGELPETTLAVIADRQEGNMQVAIIGLVFDNEADAQIAVDEVTKRISTYFDVLKFARVHDLEPPVFIDSVEGGAINDGFVYYSETTGSYAAIISVDYPMPEGPFIVGSEDSPPESAVIFRAWILSIREGFLYPFWNVIQPVE
jgi:hypothetical protein